MQTLVSKYGAFSRVIPNTCKQLNFAKNPSSGAGPLAKSTDGYHFNEELCSLWYRSNQVRSF